jgi:hypothetical protein
MCGYVAIIWVWVLITWKSGNESTKYNIFLLKIDGPKMVFLQRWSVVIIKLWIVAITYLTKIVQQFESKKGVNLVGETVGCKFDEGEIIVIRG